MEGKHLIIFSLMMQCLFFELLTIYELISYFTLKIYVVISHGPWLLLACSQYLFPFEECKPESRKDDYGFTFLIHET